MNYYAGDRWSAGIGGVGFEVTPSSEAKIELEKTRATITNAAAGVKEAAKSAGDAASAGGKAIGIGLGFVAFSLIIFGRRPKKV